MNHTSPQFSDDDINRIKLSLPAGANPERLRVLGNMLRHWSCTELGEHLAREQLKSRWKESNKALAKVGKRAQGLLQELEALDDYSNAQVITAMERIDNKKPSNFGRRARAKAKMSVANGFLFLRTISSVATKDGRGFPPNITAYLVMLDAAAIFKWVTGEKAARRVDRTTGKEGGPFRSFLEALWPVVFGNGIHGLQAAMRNWEKYRNLYEEESTFFANLLLRARNGRLIGWQSTNTPPCDGG